MEATFWRNVAIIRRIQILKMFMVAMPVIVIYWRSLGYSFFDIMLLQGVFSATVLACEVPSGYFADRMTRRLSIIVGLWLAALGWGIYSLSTELWVFMIAEVFIGLAWAFTSGADKALLYDSLLALGVDDPEKAMRSITFRNNAFGFGGEAVAGLLAGALAVISLRVPLASQVLVAAIAIPLGYKLIEPQIVKQQHKANPLSEIVSVVKHALHHNTGVKWLILLNAALGTMTYTFVWFAQPYYEKAGLPLWLFGAVAAGTHGVLMLVSIFAERLIRRIGATRVLISLPVVGVLSYLGLSIGFFLWLIPFVAGFQYVRALGRPILESRMHSLVDSDFRATVDSVSSMMSRLFYMITGLGMGLFGDRYGILATLLFSAAFYAAMCGLIVLAMHRRNILAFSGR